MFGKFDRWIYRWMVISAVLSCVLCSCSSHVGLRADDIRSSEDSIIVGRMRFLPGTSCTASFQLPVFELRNVTERKPISFAPGWIKPEMYQRVDIPISRKVPPGTYELRIKVAEGPPQSTWIQPGWLTLVTFEVPKGLLVYFGTVEVDLSCEEFHKDGTAQYVKHTIRDEFELETDLFKDESPQVFELYKNRIIHAEPQEHWKKL
jgi:hypothetical protein